MDLTKPLVVLDFETTGLSIQTDRIVQIGAIWYYPDGKPPYEWKVLVNPTVPISPEATAIHGITNEMVANVGIFAQIADSFKASLEGCDLCGHNILAFDLPLLEAEFHNAGRGEFDRSGRDIIDTLQIFRRMVPHTLAGAVKFFLGEEFPEAHDALEDAKVTLKVLECMQIMFGEHFKGTVSECPPSTVTELAKFSVPEDYATSCGKLRYNKEGEVCVGFGKKHNGTLLKGVALVDPSYLTWILSNDFSSEVKEHCVQALGEVGIGVV